MTPRKEEIGGRPSWLASIYYCSNQLLDVTIHRKIRDGRLALELTDQQFADKVGVSRGAVQQWENGKTAPSRKNAPRVAAALGIGVAELLAGLPDRTSPADGELSAQAQSLGWLLDQIQDPIQRVVGYNAATTALLKILEPGRRER